MAFDPDRHRELAREQEPENRRFLRWLRYGCRRSDRHLAKLQRAIAERVWQEVDCTQCANCCARMKLQMSARDCIPLARLLEMKTSDFRREHADRHRDGLWYLRKQPCLFLDVETRKCTIYLSRPSRCRGFPYLTGTVRDDLPGTLLNARYCPAVLRALEELRAHPDLQRRRRAGGEGDRRTE